MELFRFALLVCAFLIIVALAPIANALEYTPLSENFVKDIQTQFKGAITPDIQTLTAKKTWNCSLYGMRSRKQSQVKKAFYAFNTAEADNSSVKNDGSQVVSKYKATEMGLKGNVGPLADTLRISADGQKLISEISIPTREKRNDAVYAVADSGRTVIAYSVCN